MLNNSKAEGKQKLRKQQSLAFMALTAQWGETEKKQDERGEQVMYLMVQKAIEERKAGLWAERVRGSAGCVARCFLSRTVLEGSRPAGDAGACGAEACRPGLGGGPVEHEGPEAGLSHLRSSEGAAGLERNGGECR